MKRIGPAAIACLLLMGGRAWGQFVLNPDSTPQGDYLRGVGFALTGLGQFNAGLGQYNVETARAEQIQVESFITLNKYLLEVTDAERARQARIRAKRKADILLRQAEQRERILNAPEEFDIRVGDALNASIGRLTSGAVHPSIFRDTPVPLAADVVRRLPFTLSEEGATLSLPRMLHRGIGAWPVAFQGDQFAAERDAYDRAISDAIDQQIEGKVTLEVIDRAEEAVGALRRRLDRVVDPTDRALYFPAFNHLLGLEKSVELFKSHKIEAVVADLDTYQGTTVQELVMFMIKHKVAFAPAERPEERKAYREVYSALATQRELLGDQGPGAER
jgi:hypothetical protein